MYILPTRGYCFDDVLLVPQQSEVQSRKDVDLSTTLGNLKLQIPIISANMATVTEASMASRMHDLGGLGILHRFNTDEVIEQQIKYLLENKVPCVPSIGIGEQELERAKKYFELGVRAICIDVAHGAMKSVEKLVKELDFVNRNKGYDLTIIAGNVANRNATAALFMAGAHVVKVGVGPGSVCSTRIVTGHGVPQLTAIMECSEAKGFAGVRMKIKNPTIIADGGIRNSGDIVKALAAGADAVMIGGLFAGTEETPGIPTREADGYMYKHYRGMASGSQQVMSKGFVSGTPEGVESLVPVKGAVQPIVAKLLAGVRSGLSYSGAFNIPALQNDAEFMIVSTASLKESAPHFDAWSQ